MVLPMLSAQLEEFARQGSEMNNKPVLRPDPKETEARLCQIGAALSRKMQAEIVWDGGGRRGDRRTRS